MKTLELDGKVTLEVQVQQNISPVIQITTYTVSLDEIDQFLDTWALIAGFVKKTVSGIISIQLHRGVAGSNVFLAYLIFESTDSIRQLYKNSDFPVLLSKYPSSTVASPHLFEKIAIPGICTR